MDDYLCSKEYDAIKKNQHNQKIVHAQGISYVNSFINLLKSLQEICNPIMYSTVLNFILTRAVKVGCPACRSANG